MRIRYLPNQIEVQSPAKVNLFLELLGQREDGFHQIETVISAVSIFDTLRFSPRRDDQIKLTVASSYPDPTLAATIPTDSGNLIVRALERLREEFAPQRGGVDIWLSKAIPSQAGLGGGSSNAAAALLAGNALWGLGADSKKLHSLAAELGSDVPFFLDCGTALCTGRGEQVQPLAVPAGLSLVVAMPPERLETAQVFRTHAALASDHPFAAQTSTALVRSCRRGRPVEIATGLFNRLQAAARQLVGSSESLAIFFSRLGGCLGHHMSGSGSSYFGVFSNHRTAVSGARRLSALAPDVNVFVCKTLGLFKPGLAVNR